MVPSSPPPPPLHSSSSDPPPPQSIAAKDERDPITAASSSDLYEVRSTSRGNDSDRPPSNKTDRSSNNGGGNTPNEYDTRRSPASISSPRKTPVSSAGFPSDSTTDPVPGPSGMIRGGFSSSKDDQRIRRASDPGMDVDDDPRDNESSRKLAEYRNSREELDRISDSSRNRNTGKKMIIDTDVSIAV